MLESLRSFRRNAVHVRRAADALRADPGKASVGAGPDDALMERHKRLSIPVRRALNASDRASFVQAATELATVDRANVRSGLEAAQTAWAALQQELDRPLGLGGTRVPQRQILAAWLEAAAFYDTREHDRPYDRLINDYGPAAQGLGSELTEQAVRVILQLDEATAAALDEPVILPPAVKTPPPPPDPKESWWKRVSAMLRAPKDQ